MMKKIFFLLSVVSGLAAAPRSFAQSPEVSEPLEKTPSSYSILTYSPALSVGNMSDFVSDFTFAGVGLEVGGKVKNNFLVGVSAHFTYFNDDRDAQTYNFTRNGAQGAIYGKQFRSQYVVPLQIKGTYLYDTKTKVRPFGALGIGATYQYRDFDIGLLSFDRIGWVFSLAPEAGVKYGVRPDVSAYGSVRYDVGFGTNDLPSIGFVSFSLGVMYEM